MDMTRLKVEHFGPIKSVDVSLGDLNILIGPQASGKSLFLELFKLVMDHANIVDVLRKYNYILSKTRSIECSCPSQAGTILTFIPLS